jgi:hypothetical protein
VQAKLDFLWRLEPKLSEAGWIHLNWVGPGNTFIKPNWPGNHLYSQLGANNVSVELHPEHEQELRPGWSVLYSALKWLRTDGSDHSIKMFDDSSWPDAVLVGWPVVYWTVSRALLAL